MGASFGAGGSNTVFGASGSGNFLTRSTAILATIFFAVSLALGNLSNGQGSTEETWETIGTEVPVVQEQAPVNNDVPVANQDDNSDVPAADDGSDNN